MILADTDVIIDYLSGAEPTASHVEDYVNTDSLQISAITCFELLTGAQANKRGENLRRLLSVLTVLPLDRVAATKAASVRQNSVASGRSIPMADSLIAGTAIANEMALLTRNRKHFENVEGLELVAPRRHES